MPYENERGMKGTREVLKKIETGKTAPTSEQKEHMEVVFEKVSIMSI